jgi:hypothetical protein
MYRRPHTLALLIAFAMVLVCSPLGAQVAQGAVTFPVTGTGTSPLGPVSFVGDFTVKTFQVVNNAVVAVGTLSGDVTGAVTGTVTNLKVNIPLLTGTAPTACDILHLELGPLDLNLLGLVVHLDKVVLDIDAQPGEGNLLGNLLCAIAGLLDPGNIPSNIIADLLNALLDLLEFLR